MPSSTMEHEDQWKLPKETPFPAVLKVVKEETREYTIKKGKDAGKKDSFTKWSWEFEIVDGDYAGLRAWGESPPKITNHPENNGRQWAETLRGAPFEMHEGFDTDDVLGVPCVITVDNVIYDKADGSKGYKCPVADVFPAGSLIQDDEPPF